LDGKHCWAITGTPLMNGVEEFYSLFKFIKGDYDPPKRQKSMLTTKMQSRTDLEA
jgi:SNF2 family DNA or RNA helicase